MGRHHALHLEPRPLDAAGWRDPRPYAARCRCVDRQRLSARRHGDGDRNAAGRPLAPRQRSRAGDIRFYAAGFEGGEAVIVQRGPRHDCAGEGAFQPESRAELSARAKGDGRQADFIIDGNPILTAIDGTFRYGMAGLRMAMRRADERCAARDRGFCVTTDPIRFDPDARGSLGRHPRRGPVAAGGRQHAEPAACRFRRRRHQGRAAAGRSAARVEGRRARRCSGRSMAATSARSC